MGSTPQLAASLHVGQKNVDLLRSRWRRALPAHLEEYPVVKPAHHARQDFRKYSIAVTLLGGFAFASYMTDNKIRNEWYSRPDFKPKAAMVNDTSTLYDDKVFAQMKGEF